MPTMTHSPAQRKVWLKEKQIAKENQETKRRINQERKAASGGLMVTGFFSKGRGKKESLWSSDPLTHKKRTIRRATGGRP